MSIYKVEICGVNTAKLPLLSNEEKEDLFRRIKEGDAEARELYIKGNLRLVLSVIQRFSGNSENVDDLFQIGCIGLIKAIDNFDISKLSMALISPMQPIWNRSSTFSELPEKRWITLKTRRRLPLIYNSRASASPSLMRRNRSSFSSLLRSGSLAVFTPQISTLYMDIPVTSASL